MTDSKTQRIQSILEKIMPKGMSFDIEHYKCFLIGNSVKGKNYIVYNDKDQLKMFGVSFKSARIEKYGRQFMEDVARLIIDNKTDKVGDLYREYQNKILEHKFPIEWLSKSQEIKRTVDEYYRNKKTTDKFYEMMERHEIEPEIGNRISFYKTISGEYKPSDMYDSALPDEDVESLLVNMKRFAERFKGILTTEEYAKYFDSSDHENVDDYKYIDASFQYTKNDKIGFSKWYRLSRNTYKNYAKKWSDKGHAFFCSPHRYKTKDVIRGEKFVMPFYFDLDAHRLEDAYEDSQKIINFFKGLDIPREWIKTYFSGNRGMHIIMSDKIFGIRPDIDLNRRINYIRKKMVTELNLKTVDLNQEGVRKLLRDVNSINFKSGLYKIALATTIPDVKGLKLLAQTQQEDLYENIFPHEIAKAKEWFKKMMVGYKPPSVSSAFKSKIECLPVCVKDVLTNGLQKEGYGHKTVMNIACYLKQRGMCIEDAEKIITKWHSGKSKKYLPNREDDIEKSMSTIKQIYSKDSYYFDCKFMLSLPWNIECDKKGCPIAKEKNKEERERNTERDNGFSESSRLDRRKIQFGWYLQESNRNIYSPIPAWD